MNARFSQTISAGGDCANLHELIMHSSSTRRYFLSLPVSVQMQLHEQGGYIRSAESLRLRVCALEKYNRALELSDSLSLPWRN